MNGKVANGTSKMMNGFHASTEDSEVPCLRMGEYILRFESDEYLEPMYIEKAAKELRETPERQQEALEQFMALLAGEPELYLPIDEDTKKYLIAFLRTCKYYPESAFERLRGFCKCKIKYPKYFDYVMPLNERNVFSRNLLTVSPKRDQQGRRVLIAQVGQKWKTSECSLAEITRGIYLILEAAVLEPRTQISGSILLLDLEGLSMQHIWTLSPSFAKMVLEWLQESMPMRVKAIHILRQPYIFNMGFAIFKPFMSEKLRQRIHLHGNDMQSLAEHVDPKCLPTHYGGTLNISLDQGEGLWSLLCSYSDEYQKSNNFGYETKNSRKLRKNATS